MSLTFTATIRCDSCLEELHATSDRSTEANRAYWEVKGEALKAGWAILQRGGPAKHFCPKCAERVSAKTFTRLNPDELRQVKIPGKRKIVKRIGRIYRIYCWNLAEPKANPLDLVGEIAQGQI